MRDVGITHCCEAGEVAFPGECPWHPAPTPGSGETFTICPKCAGNGYVKLRGADRIREAMGWPIEQEPTACLECRGRCLVIISQVELDERQKPNSEKPASTKFSYLADQRIIDLKDIP